MRRERAPTPRGSSPSTLLDDLLVQAALSFDPVAVRDALAHGAHPDARFSPGGPTALMRACERPIERALACVALLLAAGADPNLRDPRGDTAAMWAAGHANRAGIEALARAGADLGAKDLAQWGIEEFAVGSMDAAFVAWAKAYAAAWRDERELGASTPRPPVGAGAVPGPRKAAL